VTQETAPGTPQPRPGILDISPYVPGRARADGVNRTIALAANENPLGASPAAAAAYREEAAKLHRYPDGGSTALAAALAESEGLDPKRIVCGAGSDELIQLLVRGYAGVGDEVLYSQHGFLVYPLAAKAVGARPVTAPESDLRADVDALLDKVTERTKLLFIANPNNPTGSYLSDEEIRRLHAGLPSGVVLAIDAAYAEYVTAADYASGAALVEEAGNIVMLRTFSKIHGLAALRLGWCYGPAGIIDVLHRIRGPFNVGRPAQAAGLAAVQDRDHVLRSREYNGRALAEFRAAVLALGLEAPRSHGNFQLVGFGSAERAKAAEAHLSKLGILTRVMTAYGLPAHLRISIGLEEEMQSVTAALSDFLA